jgi:hypothetical protein
VAAGEAFTVRLPFLPSGRYLVTLEASGFRQAAWIDR